MVQNLCSLSALSPGQRARVERLRMEGPMRRRLLDLGLTGGTEVYCLGRSPGGDPTAYLIRGAVVALRRGDCENIAVRDVAGGGLWD